MPKNNLLELEIEGMTCTACARRVEKNLNKLSGVTAYVDFATEKAHLQLTPEVTQAQLSEAVESAGYKVGSGRSELQTLKPRLWIGVIFATLTMLFGMVPMLSFTGSQYLVWALATVVIGGIITSTLLTLVILPALYRLSHRRELVTTKV